MIEQVLTELTHCRGKFPEEAMAWLWSTGLRSPPP